MSKNLKICVLSEQAYPHIAGKDDEYGGAELQMSLLAKGLANKSYDVTFVTFVKSCRSPEIFNGIKVYNPFNNRGSGYTYLRPQNMYKLFKILNKINADICIQRATTPLTGAIAFFAKLRNKVFLYSSSSDNDVSNALIIKSIKDIKKLSYRFGVKYCKYVLCQTNRQKKLLKQTLGKDGKIFKNLYIPPKREYTSKDTSKLKVIWVGRIHIDKKAELFLKLAENLPEFKFWMIGGPCRDIDYYNKIKKESQRVSNLEFIGFVPHNKINRYYVESSLLINTSSNEGFPNTFLEAWGNYVPVVSLGFDPDEIICNHKLGFHSKTFNQLVENTKMLLTNQALYKEMARNGRRYVEKEHKIDHIINKYIELFKAVT